MKLDCRKKIGILCNIFVDIIGIGMSVYSFSYSSISHLRTLPIFMLLAFILLVEYFMRISPGKYWLYLCLGVVAAVNLLSLVLPPISPYIDYLISNPWWLVFFVHLILSIKILWKPQSVLFHRFKD